MTKITTYTLSLLLIGIKTPQATQKEHPSKKHTLLKSQTLNTNNQEQSKVEDNPFYLQDGMYRIILETNTSYDKILVYDTKTKTLEVKKLTYNNTESLESRYIIKRDKSLYYYFCVENEDSDSNGNKLFRLQANGSWRHTLYHNKGTVGIKKDEEDDDSFLFSFKQAKQNYKNKENLSQKTLSKNSSKMKMYTGELQDKQGNQLTGLLRGLIIMSFAHKNRKIPAFTTRNVDTGHY